MAGVDLLADDVPAGVDLLADDPNLLPADQPGWDWLRNNYPGFFQGAREMVAGTAEGVGNLPNTVANAIPSVVNKVGDLYHAHTDEPGTEPPEPIMDRWTERGKFGEGVAELNPPEQPGYEAYRDYGRMTGTAGIAGPGAAVAIPALSKLGSMAGSVIDYATGDPSIREQQTIQDYVLDSGTDTPQGKWSQTGEFLGPLGTTGAIKGGKAAARSPTAAKVTDAAVSSAGPLAGLATLMKTGSLPSAYVAAKAAPATLRGVGKVAGMAAPVLKPLINLAEGAPGISNLLSRALVPATPDERRR